MAKQPAYRVSRLTFQAFHNEFDLSKTVDHINRVRDDNDVSNLREYTMKEQATNRSPPRRHNKHAVIMQICAVSGSTISNWLSMDEIIQKYPGIDKFKLESSLANNLPIELEKSFWVRKSASYFKTTKFEWVDAKLPPNKHNITSCNFKVCRNGLIKKQNAIITPGTLTANQYRAVTCQGQCISCS